MQVPRLPVWLQSDQHSMAVCTLSRLRRRPQRSTTTLTLVSWLAQAGVDKYRSAAEEAEAEVMDLKQKLERATTKVQETYALQRSTKSRASRAKSELASIEHEAQLLV